MLNLMQTAPDGMDEDYGTGMKSQIASEEALDELLSRPGTALVEAVKQLRSPLVVFGASGKMGPSLCVLAQRAAAAAQTRLRVIAISRFTDPRTRSWLED